MCGAPRLGLEKGFLGGGEQSLARRGCSANMPGGVKQPDVCARGLLIASAG